MDTSIEARLQKLEESFKRAVRPRHRGFAKHGEAAEYLGISRETLRRLNLAGKGPPRTKDGRYSYESLDSFNLP